MSPSPGFEFVEEWPDRDTLLLGVDGEVDLATASAFGAAIADAVDQGTRRVIVDLLGIAFIDVAGMRVLVKAHERMRERGGQLIIVAHNPPLLQVFELMGLSSEITVVPSRAAALAL